MGKKGYTKMKLILASGSPRRRQLLEQMGVTDFQVITSDVDETVEDGLSPAQVVEQLSLKKAKAVADIVDKQSIVIASDTVVAFGSAILGKPESVQEAEQMLADLQGNHHQVYTGVTLVREDDVVTFHEVTQVKFRTLTPEEISAYVATGEPMDKAGSYGIQGYGSMLVEGIQGDYFNVMGLPVCKLSQILKTWGVDLLRG